MPTKRMSTKKKSQEFDPPHMLTEIKWSPKSTLSIDDKKELSQISFLNEVAQKRYSRFGHRYMYLILDPAMTDQEYYMGGKVIPCPTIVALWMDASIRDVLRAIKVLVNKMKCDSNYDYSGRRLKSLRALSPDTAIFEVNFKSK